MITKKWTLTYLSLIMIFLELIKAFSNTSLYINDAYDTCFQVLSYVSYAALLICCLKSKIRKRYFYIAISIAFFLVITTVYNGNFFLLVTFVSVLACNKANYTELVSVLFKTTILSIILIVSLHFLGLFPSINKLQDGFVRTSLGFRHVNTCGLYFLSALLMGIILYFRKWKKRYYLYSVSVIIAVYMTCRSLTSIACSAFAVFLVIVMKYWGENIIKNKMFKVLLLSFIPFCFLLTYMCAKWYSNSNILLSLNKITTDRLFLNSIYFKNGAISLFSKPFTLTNWYLDNAYANLLLFNGLIPSIIYCLINIFNIHKAMQERQFGVIICNLVFAVYALLETGAIYFWFNVSIIYALTREYDISLKRGINDENRNRYNDISCIE